MNGRTDKRTDGQGDCNIAPILDIINYFSKKVAWSGVCGSKKVAWSGVCGSKKVAWSGVCGSKKVAWSGKA